MDRGLKFSLGLHGVLILMILIGMPRIFQHEPELLKPIPIELMADAEMAEHSSAPLKQIPKDKPEEVKEEPKPKPKPKPSEDKPEPAKPQEEVKPEPVVEQPKPEPKPEVKPEVKPEPKPEAIKLPDKKPEPPKETPKPPEKPKDKPKAEPKKKEEKPEPPKNRLSSVLKNLKKEVEDTPPTEDEVKDVKSKSSPASASNVSDVLTQDELSALRRQIAGCWNMPAGSLDARELLVDVRVWTSPDRMVLKAEILDTGRMTRDPYFRTAAESALRAVRNPACSPLMLPPNKYDQWKVFVFSFNPRDML